MFGEVRKVVHSFKEYYYKKYNTRNIRFFKYRSIITRDIDFAYANNEDSLAIQNELVEKFKESLDIEIIYEELDWLT